MFHPRQAATSKKGEDVHVRCKVTAYRALKGLSSVVGLQAVVLLPRVIDFLPPESNFLEEEAWHDSSAYYHVKSINVGSLTSICRRSGLENVYSQSPMPIVCSMQRFLRPMTKQINNSEAALPSFRSVKNVSNVNSSRSHVYRGS